MQAAIEERVREYLANLATDDSNRKSNGSASTDAQHDITELILDGRTIRSVSTDDAETLRKFTNISKLTLNQTGLASFSNIPLMPSIRALEATDNHITSGLNLLAKCFPNLKRLQLGGNHIKTFDELQPLGELTQLEQLGLDLNPVTSINDYRERLFNLIPSLQILDSRDKSGAELEVADSDSEEESEGDELDTTLKDFYEGEMPEQDAEDAEDFEPPCDAEEDDDIDEDDEDSEEEGDSDSSETAKRKADAEAAAAANKVPRHN